MGKFDLVLALQTLSCRLEETGRVEASYEAVDEALRLYKGVVANQPESSRVKCAEAVAAMARAIEKTTKRPIKLRPDVKMLEGWGKVYEAELAYRKGQQGDTNLMEVTVVAISRAVYEARFRRDEYSTARLAQLLDTLTIERTSLDYSLEAVKLYRELSYVKPNTYRLELANALSQQSTLLASVDRSLEALQAIEEAFKLHKTLFESNAGAYRVYYADTRLKLSQRLADVGRKDEALKATELAT